MSFTNFATWLLGAALWVSTGTAVARSHATQHELEAASYRGDLALLEQRHGQLQAAARAAAGNAQAVYDYALSGYLLAMTSTDRSRSKAVLGEATDALQAVTAAADDVETPVLHALVLGARIGLNPLQGMMLGPRASALLERAGAVAAGNPRLLLARGIFSCTTPQAFGGDPARARGELAAALAAFAQYAAQGPVQADWGLPLTHAWSGLCLAMAKDKDGAREQYRLALAAAPDFAWVRDQLLPALDPATKPAEPAPATRPRPGQGASFALRAVRVFDGERVQPRVNVVVRDGRIAAVGPDVVIPRGSHVVDGNGATLLPGLIDAHVHAWGDARRDALRFGVTTELDMFGDVHALAAARHERNEPARTDLADLWSAGTLVTAPAGHGTEYGMPIPTLADAAAADDFVRARIDEGSDYIKLIRDDGSAYGGQHHMATLDDATVKAVIAAAHANGKLAIIHAVKADDAEFALANGVDGLAHAFFDRAASPAMIALAREHPAFMVPTLTVFASMSGSDAARTLREDPRIAPQLGELQRTMLDQVASVLPPQALATAMANVRAFHVAGVPILAGTDAGNPGTAHGASLHGELALLVKAGLTPVAALRAATAAPADAFGLKDRGRIAAGLRADLVLVDGDPTADITRTRAIRQVWKNGYVVDRAAPPDAPAVGQQ